MTKKLTKRTIDYLIECLEEREERQKVQNSIMVALISPAAVAHLALQELTSASWNSYITLVISHERDKESCLLCPLQLLLHSSTE